MCTPYCFYNSHYTFSEQQLFICFPTPLCLAPPPWGARLFLSFLFLFSAFASLHLWCVTMYTTLLHSSIHAIHYIIPASHHPPDPPLAITTSDPKS